MPLTYWLERLRRALVGLVAREFPTLSSLSDVALFGILVGTTAGCAVLALVVFSIAERVARERGLIDRTTNY
jgi:ABC-2 type transport system permease protein